MQVNIALRANFPLTLYHCIAILQYGCNTRPLPKLGRVGKSEKNGFVFKCNSGLLLTTWLIMSTPLKNPRHERFAALVALGQVSLSEAAKQAGYAESGKGKVGQRLTQNALIASRIESMRATLSIKHDVTRDKVIAEVAKLALAEPQPAVPTPSEKLKALSQLAAMLGYNEAERTVHEHTHISVDAGLLAQLRAGYAEAKQATVALVHSVETGAGHTTGSTPHLHIETGAPTPAPSAEE